VFLQQLVNGLTIGSTYAIFAVGYTLILGVLGVVNMAHGTVFTLSAYAGLLVASNLSTNIVVILLAGMFIGAFLGLLLELVVFRPIRVRNAGPMASLIGTIGISIFLQSFAERTFGPQTQQFPSGIIEGTFTIGTIQISYIQILSFLTAIGLMLVIGYFINSTKTGRAIRSTAENPEASSLLGINTNAITMITMVLASALAGAAGVLIGLMYNAIEPTMGSSMSFNGLAVIIFGGLGNVKGAVIGGFILGVAEVFTVAFGLSHFREAVAFILIIVILFFRPQGLFGDSRKGGRL
jgi:branched-chain amino acid transport system permease protein